MRYKDSMKGIADQIFKEQQRARRIKDNPERFRWYDEYATLKFFRSVCKNLGNLSNPEIEKLVKHLKSIDIKTMQKHTIGSIYMFDYEKMFQALQENAVCRKVCEKNNYKNWMQIIANYCVPSYNEYETLYTKKDSGNIERFEEEDDYYGEE